MSFKIFISVFYLWMSMAFGQDPSTSIVKNSDFKIQPNPATTEFTIEFPQQYAIAKLEVFDVLGSRLINRTISKIEASVNVFEWNSGVYLVRISTSDGSQTKRFVKP